MKKQVFFLTLLSMFLIVSFSCNKDIKEFEIKGKITDPMLNKPISGAVVILSGNKIQSGVFNSSYVELGRATSDQNGNYTFKIKYENVGGYRFAVLTPDYFDISEDVTTQTLQATEIFSKDFLQYPQSTIEINVKNTMPQGVDDQVKWRFVNADQKCKTCCNSVSNTCIGVAYDQTTECKVVGNRYLIIEYAVTKNNNTTSKTDSIFMHCFTKESYNLHY